MTHMPEWFAKTPEMMAMDRYYSGLDGPAELIDRYQKALGDVTGQQYFDDSKALGREAPSLKRPSVDLHFKGDWLYRGDPFSPVQGGEYWPTLPSREVVEGLKYGMEIALKRALGRNNLPSSLSLSNDELDELFGYSDSIGIDTNNVLPLVTSWNCVAPQGSTFFDTRAIRGPTVVEWAIATPAPIRHTSDHVFARVYRDRDYGVESHTTE